MDPKKEWDRIREEISNDGAKLEHAGLLDLESRRPTHPIIAAERLEIRHAATMAAIGMYLIRELVEIRRQLELLRDRP
jgi:hypothetical protein